MQIYRPLSKIPTPRVHTHWRLLPEPASSVMVAQRFSNPRSASTFTYWPFPSSRALPAHLFIYYYYGVVDSYCFQHISLIVIYDLQGLL